jgi:hypothetical protein
MTLTRIEKMNQYKADCNEIDTLLSIENKIFLVEYSLHVFGEHYDKGSCDMCCGGGDEHWDELSTFLEALENGQDVHFYDIDERLFD